jgi:hypothetical protein
MGFGLKVSHTHVWSVLEPKPGFGLRFRFGFIIK